MNNIKELHTEMKLLGEIADLKAELKASKEEQNRLRSAAITWEKVWSVLEQHKFVRNITLEHAVHGNSSCSIILLDAFARLYQDHLDYHEEAEY